MRLKARQAASLPELMVAMGIFLSVAAITGRLYDDVGSQIKRGSQRMEVTSRIRNCAGRLTTLLSPACPAAGGTSVYANETELATNTTAGVPLRQQGAERIQFYSPVNLWDPQAQLLPGSHLTTRLFELRLQPAPAGQPVLRDLVLQEKEWVGGAIVDRAGIAPRVVARGLSHLRFVRAGAASVRVCLEAQGVEPRTQSGRPQLFTQAMETRVTFPALGSP